MGDKFQEGKERLVGYLETDTGTILLTDGIWNTEIPSANQKRVYLNLGMPRVKIPVYGVIRNQKRYLILDVDRALENSNSQDTVEVEERELPDKEPGPSFEDQEIPFAMQDFPRQPDEEGEAEEEQE
jgi:hypothetical protein